MKGFKLFLLVFFIFNFIKCNKDSKVKPFERVLPNGKYFLHSKSCEDCNGTTYYYIQDNILFALRRISSDSICLTRKAGEIFKNSNGEIAFSPLNMATTNSNDPCVFASDIYGGDTMIFHLSNISQEISNLGVNYIKGNFFMRMPSGLPFENQEGLFTLGITK